MSQIKVVLTLSADEDKLLRQRWLSDLAEGDYYATLNTWVKNIVMEKVKE